MSSYLCQFILKLSTFVHNENCQIGQSDLIKIRSENIDHIRNINGYLIKKISNFGQQNYECLHSKYDFCI